MNNTTKYVLVGVGVLALVGVSVFAIASTKKKKLLLSPIKPPSPATVTGIADNVLDTVIGSIKGNSDTSAQTIAKGNENAQEKKDILVGLPFEPNSKPTPPPETTTDVSDKVISSIKGNGDSNKRISEQRIAKRQTKQENRAITKQTKQENRAITKQAKLLKRGKIKLSDLQAIKKG
ncbi:MAG: hypothetical protein ACOVNU_09155 [Candidatus Kapaibacteriota bacterium]